MSYPPAILDTSFHTLAHTHSACGDLDSRYGLCVRGVDVSRLFHSWSNHASNGLVLNPRKMDGTAFSDAAHQTRSHLQRH